ncbi:MAG TPA: ferrous iron transporter B [Clostridiaceae bacterium]|nr:ferrous iron transporter B [Clostridiaceae bacterium]
MRVLLTGNPNVGKSAIFSKLTGIDVTTSNYPGTTVEFFSGTMNWKGKTIEIVDVPGIYQLNPEAAAEKVAAQMIATGDVLLNVVDATNLERNLNLTLQLMKIGKPIVMALNMWDETKHKGIQIDVDKLSAILGIKVIPTSGRSGEGISCLADAVLNAKQAPETNWMDKDRWKTIGFIVDKVQNLSGRKHTTIEYIQDLFVNPVLGPVLSCGVLYAAFTGIMRLGKLIEKTVLSAFEKYYSHVILTISKFLGGSGFLHEILIGETGAGGVDFEAAMGVLTTGVYVSFGIVLPYVFLFYLVFGFLEDLGFLPRVAVIFDRLLKKAGLHGFSIIPMFLACGCNVPGILAVRNLETRRERFITAVLTGITIPCMAQTALVMRMVGENDGIFVLLVICTLLTVWCILGLFLKSTVKGITPSLLMEVPPYRLPGINAQLKKIRMRMTCFFKDAMPYVLGGIAFINVLRITGIIKLMGKLAEPLITGVFGLPQDAVLALIIGIIRKDTAVAMLAPLNLNSTQTFVAVIILILYFPCTATFTVLLRELGAVDTIKAVLLMLVTTISAGGLLNLALSTVYTPRGLLITEILIIILVIEILEPVKRAATEKKQ